MSTRWFAIVALIASVSINVACSHAPPIVEPAITCGANLVSADNIRRVEKDLANMSGGGEADLLAWAMTSGPDFVLCLVDWYIQNGSAPQRTAASQFKTGHKAQLTPAVSGICIGCRIHVACTPPGIGPGLAEGGG